MTEAGNTQAGQMDTSSETRGGEKKSVSGLTVLVTIVSYVAYAVILYKSQNAETLRKILAGVIFLVLAPIGVGIGGIVGSLITPTFVMASDAMGLLKMRLFWWVGPRFIGAGIAGFLSTVAGAPAILG